MVIYTKLEGASDPLVMVHEDGVLMYLGSHEARITVKLTLDEGKELLTALSRGFHMFSQRIGETNEVK